MSLQGLLRGERVTLSALAEGDAPTIAGWYHDPDFMRLSDSTPAYPRSAEHWRRWIRDLSEDKSTYTFAIRLPGSNALIGWIELDSVQWQHGVVGLGIAIGDPAHRGQGYGYEAISLALDFAFRELNLHRVQLTVFSYNTRAIALYERMGFRHEGVYREFLRRDGQRYDMLLYGLLAREWLSTDE